LHVPDVQIELDENALTDSDGYQTPIGSLRRIDDRLELHVNLEGQYRTYGKHITVLTGLPMCAQRNSACFLKWQIVIGEGDEKRVLYHVDVSPKTDIL